MNSYEVEVFIDGEPTYIVDIPFAQSPEAAERRAKFAIASQHRQTNLDRITTKVVH